MRLDLEGLRHRAAEALGLSERCDDRAEFGDVHAIGHGGERHAALDSDAHVLSDTGEFVGDRPVARPSSPGQRGIDTEAGLHHHADLIDDVGEFPTNRLVAVVDASLQQHVGQHEAAGATEQHEQHTDECEVDRAGAARTAQPTAISTLIANSRSTDHPTGEPALASCFSSLVTRPAGRPASDARDRVARVPAW